ncbi:MAG TPA: nucleoside-diphosphate sugar epimerase/dehydratase [Gemmatimonadaceae bacterium]|nr:nucleoside-diphosphate sugar epimerase/dehydratase [Gemmatimonadaceae bacterium]
MMPPLLVRHRRPLILAGHAFIVAAAYAVAFLLRFDGPVPPDAVLAFELTVMPLVIIRLAVFAAYGLHRGFWRHFGHRDLIALAKAVAMGTVIFILALLAGSRLGPVPRSVVIMEAMLTFLLAGGSRLAVRSAREWFARRRAGERRPTIVIGAGAAAERLLRQLAHGDGVGLELRPVALLDDDPDKWSMSLHGVPVVGSVNRLEEAVQRFAAELVVIAIPRATPAELRRIVDLCLATKVEFKRLPSMREMLQGSARSGELAEVELEHLLVREPVAFDTELVARDLAGSVVLITGGAGSVGSELARQIARVGPSRIVLVEQAESALYFVHLELERTHPEITTVPIVADITNREAMARIFERHRPDHVYHAAAYKHVPMMESNAAEAVRNNVLGTLQVAECAARCGASKFVLISTDKAVRPSSVMGATKRVAERIVLGWPSLRSSRTEFRAVRFGNVLGSEGSVVPLFRKQLARGGPLTVTHPDVRRYFMTLPEAAQLVLHAAALPSAAGRIAMLDMGEQIRILDLAENLVRLSGLEPYRDVPINFTGLRPGEKLHEELMSSVEHTVPSGVEKIGLVQTDEVDGGAIRDGVARLLAAAARGEWGPIALALHVLVPEYSAPQIDLIQDEASFAGEGRSRGADDIAVETHPYGPAIGPRRARAEPPREPNFPLMKNA